MSDDSNMLELYLKAVLSYNVDLYLIKFSTLNIEIFYHTIRALYVCT